MTIQVKVLPKVLTFSEAKYYIFTSAFIGLAVFVPWLTHQFHLAGPKFLPMHFFVIIAGILFGWRAGMIVGVASPMLSYGITHLPPLVILPETMLELAIYGFATGALRERNLNIFTSLFVAMILGRMARMFWILSFSQPASPIKFIQISWPGIALQIFLIPIVVYLCSKILKNSQKAAGD